MSLQITSSVGYSRGGQSVTSNQNITGEGVTELDVTVGAAVTDKEVEVQFRMAALQHLLLTTDKDVTLETNSASVPGNTIALKANVPFLWVKDSGIANPFTADVTKFFFTNAGAADAAVKIRMLKDATP